MIIGGTSASAPLMAGYLASIDQKTFINPLLYNSKRLCFNDIIIGTNYDTTKKNIIKSYVAKKGYDLCSGLGSINGQILTQRIKNPTPRINPTPRSKPRINPTPRSNHRINPTPKRKMWMYFT